MLAISALLVPFMICLSWLVVLLAIEDKNFSQKRLTALLAISTVYFYIDAFYLIPEGTHSDFRTMVFLDIVSQFITTALPAAIILYIKSLQGATPNRNIITLMYVPGIFLGTAAIVIYSLMGVDNAATYISAINQAGGRPAGYDAPIYRLHETFCTKIYNVILLTEVIITLAVTVSDFVQRDVKKDGFWKFILENGKMHPMGVQCVLIMFLLGICSLRIVLGRTFLVSTPEFSGFLSVLLGAAIFCTAYIGTWFSDREFDKWSLRHPSIMRKSETAPGEVQRIMEIISTTPVKIEEQKAEPTLLDIFVTYMEEKKPYLNPELSISDVSTALKSNRTYISVLINENFGMSFRDFINKERIKYAKQIMLKNPDEILEVTAEKSGFSSDSQFAKKFKELTGTSPKAWLMHELEEQEKKEKLEPHHKI